jgi:hypothetical protein
MILKNQRRELSKFFIVSCVFYSFLLILSFCYIPIVISSASLSNNKQFDMHLGFIIFNFMLSVLCLLYVVKRINWLLIEKEEELCYRSLKIGEEVLKTEGKDEEDLKAIVENHLDTMGKNIRSVLPGKKNNTIKSNSSYINRNQMY